VLLADRAPRTKTDLNQQTALPAERWRPHCFKVFHRVSHNDGHRLTSKS
jgi:hypothetical protein